jgi:hypothetical protein
MKPQPFPATATRSLDSVASNSAFAVVQARRLNPLANRPQQCGRKRRQSGGQLIIPL